jgi:hypothetical protein
MEVGQGRKAAATLVLGPPEDGKKGVRYQLIERCEPANGRSTR